MPGGRHTPTGASFKGRLMHKDFCNVLNGAAGCTEDAAVFCRTSCGCRTICRSSSNQQLGTIHQQLAAGLTSTYALS
jgi:hypothetical protein